MSFNPALANASPEIVSLAPGVTVVELRPIVNGKLFVTCAAADVTGAPPDDAASAVGAAARAVAAMAPMLASLRDDRRAGLGNIEISVRFRGERLGADAFAVLRTIPAALGAAIGTRVLHLPGVDY